jgi:cytochrome b561
MTASTLAAPPVAGYSGIAKTLHWLVAIVILSAWPIGFALDKVPEGAIQNTLYDVHRSLGSIILFLALIRLAYRVVAGAPPPDPGLTPFERIASHSVHMLLYVLMIAVPIGGWAATSAYGAPVAVFWLFELPPLLAKNEHLSEQLFALHKIGAFVLAGLVLLHIAGALMHAVVKRDGVLARMTFGR